MSWERAPHSMSRGDRALALRVLAAAWARLSDAGDAPAVVESVYAAAVALPEDTDYARYGADAAVWYLDRATRRLGDPDRDGWTASERAANIAAFLAADGDLEALFALAAALNADDA
jgi:hypothetical protein